MFVCALAVSPLMVCILTSYHIQFALLLIDFSLNEYDNIDVGEVEPSLNTKSSSHGGVKEEEDEEEAADQVKRRRRQSVKVKGIARVADEVRELFLKVAVSDTKLVAGSNKEVSAAVCVCLFYYSSATHSKCLMSSSFNTHSCFPTSHW